MNKFKATISKVAPALAGAAMAAGSIAGCVPVYAENSFSISTATGGYS